MTAPQSPSSPPKSPTIRDVAAYAGVSPMTASRALAGSGSVSEASRARVWDAVSALGYHKNENARSLRPGHTSSLIGVAITNMGNPYYAKFALGVEDVASQLGKRMLLGNTGEDVEREKTLINDFVGRKVEGLIVVPASEDGSHLMPAAIGTTRVVLASRQVTGLDVGSVVLDDGGGSAAGTQLLIQEGHTRIAFLGNDASMFTTRRRFEGFASTMQAAGIPLDDALISHGNRDVAGARLAFAAMLDSGNPPTAVFCANNRNAVGALQELHARGLVSSSNPAVRIVSFDDFELSEMFAPVVTIIDHDPRELGRAATRMLLGSESDVTQLELPVHLRA